MLDTGGWSDLKVWDPINSGPPGWGASLRADSLPQS
jgi:hypothetical protein